ncbi:dynein regulatory complex protein 8 isoform X4 [Nomascus leucogenys]|uniref:dynein regulatory complex protein 8 isoform X4 n=1 Tax=Nomascus leucogenys TaxID=61853 RepID=UPI00122D8625|nr:dynein regulatory complex protein 8 isoform X4 [Nomascus leucogenys]
MADEKVREEIIIAEFHKKIKEAFEVFDHESNNTVDVREIGTIIRSLGCCPTEGELHDLIAEVEEEEPTGYIRFEKFLPVMTEILLERKYRPIPEDVLLRAFEVLDSAKRGFLTKDELIKYMTEEGSISSAHSPLLRVGRKGGDTLPPCPCHTVISPNASVPAPSRLRKDDMPFLLWKITILRRPTEMHVENDGNYWVSEDTMT